MMGVTAAPTPVLAPEGLEPQITRKTAVLASGCEGYPAGTHGEVLGVRDGCVIFAPFHPEQVARWASPRERVLVPPGLLVIA